MRCFFFVIDSPKVGEDFQIEAAFSEGILPFTLFYVVVNRNGIVKEDRVELKISDDQTTFKIKATEKMVPSCRVIVYYIQWTGEIVYDQVKIEVPAKSFNSVRSHIYSLPAMNPK